MKHLILLCSLAASFASSAATPDELFQKAMETGRARGPLTGSMADTLKQTTHSTYQAEMSIEKGGRDSDNCQHFLSTLVQPHVPTMNGKDAGDYVIVNAIKLCPGAADPVSILIDCKVGETSCMPKK